MKGMKWQIIFITSLVILLATKINADRLYSIDSNNNQLVTIDTSTLVVTPIGSLNIDPDFIQADGLAPISNDELLAILIFDTEYEPYGRYEFYKINTNTGNATFVADVIDGDGDPDVNLAEGLARHPSSGVIYISYSSGAFSSSDLIGIVNAETGQITNQCNLGVDMDTITFNSTGILFAFNLLPVVGDTTFEYFYDIDIATCVTNLRGSYEKEGLESISGITFLSDGMLIGILNTSSLIQINHETGEVLLPPIGDIPIDYNLRELCQAFDTDGDDFNNLDDNCPDIPNPNQEDDDIDGLGNECDNCPNTPNPDQQDSYPPQGNGIGDACDCEGDFDCNGNVDATDVTTFLDNFGRNQYNDPCINGDQCNGDFDCSGAVDAEDVTKLLEDFGRNQYNKPCPTCEVGDWCVYP